LDVSEAEELEYLKFEAKSKEKEEGEEKGKYILKTPANALREQDLVLFKQEDSERIYGGILWNKGSDEPSSADWHHFAHLTISRDQTAASDYEALQLIALQVKVNNDGDSAEKSDSAGESDSARKSGSEDFYISSTDVDLEAETEVCQKSNHVESSNLAYQLDSPGNTNDVGIYGTC
jgi:hypothetical protein